MVCRSGEGYRRGSGCVLILGLVCSCWRGKCGCGLVVEVCFGDGVVVAGSGGWVVV